MDTIPDNTEDPVNIALRRSTGVATPVIPFMPAPVVLRQAHIKEASALAMLLGRAYVTEKWEAEETEDELFRDTTVKAVLVAESEGRLLSTASLQILPDAPDSARIRWVATESDWQRRGLAKALVISLINLASEAKCKEVTLQTTTDLTGAIALYRQLGFKPFGFDDKQHAAWEQLIKRTGLSDSYLIESSEKRQDARKT